MKALSAILASMIGLVACAPIESVYEPPVVTSKELSLSRGTYYAIPPDSPRGAVHVATLDAEPLRAVGGAKDDTLPAVHVVLDIDNRDQEDWVFDGAEQRGEIDHQSIAALARTIQPLPRIEIPAHSSRSIDLFFPLGGPDSASSRPRVFELEWTVRIGGRPITHTTRFERSATNPAFEPVSSR